ncbi:MAG: xanthorhodopsin [Chloroflexota bacterium]|nr:bacteriorhodopsin [Caldilinea sp.]GIK75739.1 MAG: xanthorhodopsin [Chloroflexota bacterium]
MLNFENQFAYSPMAYEMVAHVLTLGYAVMLAALAYFILTIRSVAPRYRISSVLSVVVMVSAFLLLYAQKASWTDAFTFNAATGMYEASVTGDRFSNGFRYLNWLIDVPMLLIQILFVVEIARQRRNSMLFWFSLSGSMMIVTGYIGQFYETTNVTAWLVWGAVSTVFFVHVLYLMNRVINDGKREIPAAAARVMSAIWWLFLISWMLYPGAYLMPLFLNNEAGVVGRQMTYTVADISSKVIYGVLLSYAAMLRSRAEGYKEEMLPLFGSKSNGSGVGVERQEQPVHMPVN